MSLEAQVDAETDGAVPRRQALCGIIALGVLGPTALAACSSDKQYGQPRSDATTGNPAPQSSAPGSAPPQGGDGGIAKLSQVPIGGGAIVNTPDGKTLVVARGADGVVKAYDAACTHQATKVQAPKGGIMTCPNHGSQFKAEDGSVVKGPAASPLAEVKVVTQGDNIHLA